MQTRQSAGGLRKRLQHEPRLAGALGVLALAAALAALEWSAAPALRGTTAWIEEDRSGAAPAPLALDDVRWTLEGAGGAFATLAAAELELSPPRIGGLALNVLRRPVLADVHLALVGPNGERTDIHAQSARVEVDQVVLEGRVVARGPHGRELRSRKVVWRRDEGRLVAEGPLWLTDRQGRPQVHSKWTTDLSLGTTHGGNGAVDESDSEDELAATL